MDKLGLIQPTKVRQVPCPGLELFTYSPIGNPLLASGSDAPNRLRRLIGMRLDELRAKSPTLKIDGAAFAPLVDEGFARHEREIGDEIRAAAVMIADEIWSSGGQNPIIASHIFREYWTKLEACAFACPELLTPLFVAQEEMLFIESGGAADELQITIPVIREATIATPQEQHAGGGTVQLVREGILAQEAARAEQASIEAVRLEGEERIRRAVEGEQARIDAAAREARKRERKAIYADMLQIRLVSIREMLRHYFKECPQDYKKSLATALGVSGEEAEDPEFMEQRIAFEVARVGSWALSLRVLEEVKREINAKEPSEGKRDAGQDPWRMGLKLGKNAKHKMWSYQPPTGQPAMGSGKGVPDAIFCPRWGGLGWGVSIGMLASFLSRRSI